MEDEEKEIEKEIEIEYQPQTLLEKAKNALTKAKLSRYLSFIFVIFAVIIYSLFSVGWNPWKIGWNKFAGDTALLLFLGIYGIFFGETEGSNFFKNYAKGLFQTVLLKFRKVIKKIKDKNYVDALPDYIPWRYKKDYDNVCKMKLLSVRIYDESILNLSTDELDKLKEHPLKIGDSYYSKISDKQYEIIMDIKNGKVAVDYFDDYTFYLLEDNTEGSEQNATRVKNTPKRKDKITKRQRLSRVVLIFLFALIAAGFFKETAGGTPEEIKAAQDAALSAMFSRLTTLFISIASGINTARLLNMEDIFVIQFKTSYNELFYSCMENKTFIPIDYQAKAKEEYEKYCKTNKEDTKSLPLIINQNGIV